jgi:threonine dehydratase/serine racemase
MRPDKTPAPVPGIDEIREAADRIAGHVHRTPVLTSHTIDRELSARVFFKCENLQKVGAFKARGAVNAVLNLPPTEASRGVITHSSGNHGAALAYAASIRGIDCTVVMPEGTPAVKVDAVRGYGAEVVFCPRSERQATCDRLIEEQGRVLIHPFANFDVIAGQGTVALELLRQAETLDLVIAPVGGGGLLTGTTLTCKALEPAIELFGAEPEAVDDAYRSLTSGILQPAPVDPRTWADGLMTGLGEPNFRVLREHGVRVVTMSEDEIVAATRFVLERMKILVEPSGATVLAALRRMGDEIRGRRIGAVFTGGNTDFRWLCGPDAVARD